MSEQTAGAYGFQTDEVKFKNFQFGLNQNVRLKKFEFNPNGGKEGAEQDCVDIVFAFSDNESDDVSFRQFPVTKAFEDGNEILAADNPNHPAITKAFANLNAMMVHILRCFRDQDDLKAALAREFNGFQDFVTTLQNLLPKEFDTVALDAFMQYEWQPRSGQTRTFLQLPKKMAYGPWLCKHVEPQTGEGGERAEWVAITKPNPTKEDKVALYYEDGAGNRHPFVKNGWFMSSAFAKQQGGESSKGVLEASGEAATASSDVAGAAGQWG